MATVVAENGETSEEGPQQTDVGELRVNGEVNGSYEEPMEVDDSPLKSVKKLNSSDINLISGTTDNDNSATEHLEQSNSNSGSSVKEVDAAAGAGEIKVPEKEESTSSNGFAEEHDKEVGGADNSENNVDNGVAHKEGEVEGKEDDANDKESNAEDKKDDKENDIQDGDNSGNKESHLKGQENNTDNTNEDCENVDDDDVVMMDDEEIKDPLAADVSMQDEDKESAQVDEVKEVGNKNAVDNTSDIEQKESNGPESTEVKLMDGDCEKDNKEEDEDITEIKDDDNEEINKDKKDEESKEELETSNSSEKEKDEKMDVGEEGEKSDESPDKRKSEDENDKTPDKVKKKKTQQQPINVTPRRSSRNVNKPKTYIDEPDIKGTTTPAKKVAEDPDIEEIVPQDPLAMDSPASEKKKKTVVVSDPKRLVEIASGNKQSKPGKKEPTLVIIDTNSILSGRGPVPVSPSGVAGPSHSAGYSVLPVALPAQGLYPQPMRHTPAKPVVVSQSPSLAITPTSTPPSATKPPVILPSLTDDMYVVEAPSFIVPYVYEKPPIKPLKNFVDQVEQAIKDIKAQIEKNKENEEVKKEDEAKKTEEGEKKSEEGEKKDEKEKDEKSDKESKDIKEEEKMDVDSESSKDKNDEESTSKKDKNDTKEEEKSTEVKTEIKEEADKSTEKSSEDSKTEEGEKKKTSNSYFDNPLGKFFIQIGVNLVQEHVQTDLLRSQKRKKDREGKFTPEVQQAMNSLIRSLEFSKETNEPFKMELKKCEFCSFKTESALVMAHHLETPHMRNYVYRCNFCPLEVRSPHDILYHMEAEHNVRGRLERAPAFHQCPSCPFEDNQKGKLTRHLLSCAKKYRPERNQEPPLDFEPPAKIPRVSRTRPSMSPGTAVYQAAMSGLKQGAAGHPLLPKLVPAPTPPGLIRGRGRPQLMNRYLGDMRNPALSAQQKAMAAQMRPGMLYRPSGSNAQPPVLLPTSYQLAGTQLYQDQMSLYQQMVSNHNRGLAPAPPLVLPSQTAAAASVAGNKTSVTAVGASTAKLLQQPSISITPLPRQQPQPPALTPSAPASSQANKPGRPATASKATFVICEICDGYIKDLEQLRNHMQWIHKVKIHPKMIYNRPPLNCQKCQFRFFTDQGLERHLLGSHGLVTSSMQEAANKGKDGGRCPVCGRVYQWKLLNHVARDHNMSLKPAHLSYKCTVCTATFGMYKQFENHVYSAHSVVAKRVMDKKPATSAQPSTSSQGDMLKPLKINDEITIIPQPARTKTKQPSGPNRNPQKKV